jgi:hypothetical protein
MYLILEVVPFSSVESKLLPAPDKYVPAAFLTVWNEEKSRGFGKG